MSFGNSKTAAHVNSAVVITSIIPVLRKSHQKPRVEYEVTPLTKEPIGN